MEVEFAALGELRVTVRNIDVTPTAPKEKALLGLLTVHRGRSVATDALAEDLWPGLPGVRARRVAQVRVADLRQRFQRAGVASLLERTPPATRLAMTRPGAIGRRPAPGGSCPRLLPR